MLQTHINKPNFFILGAGKSGTTSLYKCLKTHPDIFLTEEKEPTFFCDGFQVIQNPIDYFELYDNVSTEKVIGEASHAYLSNPSSAKVIKGLFPDAKFLVILRNPADRAYSLYHHMRRHGEEYINTFEAALESEEWRYTSEKFKKNCPQYFYNSLYFHSGLYAKQLQNYFSVFPKEQFHIIKFEDFIKNPSSYFKEIYRFINVDINQDEELKTANSGSTTALFPKIQYLTNRTKLGRKYLLPLLKKINIKKTPTINPETKKLLMDRYAEDMKTLHEITGINFLD